MIRVCHMTSAHDPGDTRIFHRECVSLAKAGFDVYLVERGESYEKSGVHIVGVGEIPTSRIKRMTEGARKVYDVARDLDADIYHFHDPELLPYGMKLKKAGKRVIFDSHEDYSRQMKSKPYLPGWISRIVAALYHRYESHVVKRIDAVIFPCTVLGEKLYENVCRRVVLLDNLPWLAEAYELYDEKASRKPQCCFVGTISTARCIDEIIQAAALKDIPLVLAGSFSSEEYKQKCIAAMDGHANMQWVGKLTHEDAIKVIMNSSVGLCPEKNMLQYNAADNLSTKSYEYMALGLPVIVAEYPFSKRVMEEYRYGVLVDPDSAESIANAMRYLLDHPEQAREMGENGRRAIKERFNWDVEQKKLLTLYEEILNEK